MSEQIKPTQLLEVAEMHAEQPEQLIADEARIQEWIGKPGEDPQAARDVAEYLKSRPYTDENGRLYDPKTNEVVKHNDYENQKADEHFESTGGKPVHEKSARELLDTLADAVEHSDKTAINDVEEVINAREEEAAKQKLAGQLAGGIKALKEQKQAEAQDAQSNPEDDDERRAKKEALTDMETDELIQAWAKAELDGDDEIAKLAQDELQDQLIRARQDNFYEEDQTSEIIDNIYEKKEEEKGRLVQEQSEASEVESQAATNPKISRELRENLEADEEAAATGETSASEQDESKQKLYDYEEMIKEPVKEAKAPSTELIPVSVGENTTDTPKITLRDRFRRIKNAVVVAPTTWFGRANERFDSLTTRRKAAVLGVGAAALVGAAIGVKYGLDFANNNGGGGSAKLSVDPDLLNPGPTTDTVADSSALDAISNAVEGRTQEIANTEGLRPWNVAYDLYGDQATDRIIEAVADMQAEGIDIQWSADPLTDNTAYLTMNGISDTEYVVDQGLAEYLARKDIENFLQASESVN